MQVLRRNFLPDDLQPLLKESGVEGSVAVQADQSLTETIFLLHQAKASPFIKGVVGWIDLRSPNLESELESLSVHTLLKGFRHIVQSETDSEFMLQPDFLRGMEMILSKGYTYDILIRDHQLPMAFEFCKRFPGASFVIDHLAKPPIRSGEWRKWANDIQKFSSLDTVCCKVSGLVTEADWKTWRSEDFRIYLDVVTEVFGAGRLLYGSDWPVCLLAANYQQQLAVLQNYFSVLTNSEQESVFKTNAIRFYQL